MIRSKLFAASAAVLTTSLVLACQVAEIGGEVGEASPTMPPRTTGAVCAGAGERLSAQDPATLPKCACAKGGAARCVPKGKVPGALGEQLEACEAGGAGVCVPDSLVKSGGAAPKTCTSPFGEGRCMSLCVPEIAKNAAVLGRGEGDVCAEDERCTPCNNPLKNNEPTGVCDIGKAPPAECAEPAPAPEKGATGGGAVACPYEGPPLVDVTKFASCGERARCVPSNLVPAQAASMLDACPTGLCAPEKSIAAGGQYLPKTCATVGGGEGRCINVAVPAVKAQKDLLPRDTCDAEERCAPCFDPTSGKETGACSTVSCDKPKSAATSFKDCCKLSDGKSHGKCVPKSLVPPAALEKLGDDDGTCDEGKEVCAPAENLDPAYKPPTCSGSSFLLGKYTGVCVSNCVEFGIEGIALVRGSCSAVQTCAPCVRDGKPTGAPGCP